MSEKWVDQFFGVTEYDKGYKAGQRTATIDGVLALIGIDILSETAPPRNEWQRGFIAGYKGRVETKG